MKSSFRLVNCPSVPASKRQKKQLGNSNPLNSERRLEIRPAKGVQKAGLLGNIEHFARRVVAFAGLEIHVSFQRIRRAGLSSAAGRAAQ